MKIQTGLSLYSVTVSIFPAFISRWKAVEEIDDVEFVRHGLISACKLLPNHAHLVKLLAHVFGGGEADLVDLVASEPREGFGL